MLNRWRNSKFWSLLFALGLFGVLFKTGILQLFLNLEVLVEQFKLAGAWGATLFVLAHIIATAVGMPGTVLVVAGGMLFGLVWGTFWSVIGATLGAIAAFYAARYLLRDWVERRFSHHSALVWMKQIGDRNALLCVLAVRFAPISPFNLVNFLFGLSNIDPKSYAMGTGLGIIPGTLVYTWVGVTGSQALQGEGVIPLLIALSGLALLSAIPVVSQCMRRSPPRPPRNKRG